MSNYGEDFVFNFVGYCLGRCDSLVCHTLRKRICHMSDVPSNDYLWILIRRR